ncbi:Uncharacterised protein [Klebsiella pneumoniae subsp. ozaenae]|uniref:Putative O-antigen transporter n=1 Tax=Klebsiella pneumoniae subsp. ozaenae TaxID=574 RepID=A0A377ZBU0_KLEPO|nr:Uncharacterised protein [Klebsiella pneumoniae subsp. ozaenae]
MIAIAASFFSIQLAYEFFVYRKIAVERSVLQPLRKRYKEIISYGVSLLPHHGSYWIKSSVDRFFIAHYMSTAVVGVYGLAFQLTSIVMLFFGVINQAFQPFIYRKLKANDFRGVELIQYGTQLWLSFRALFTSLFCHLLSRICLMLSSIAPFITSTFFAWNCIFIYLLYFYALTVLLS